MHDKTLAFTVVIAAVLAAAAMPLQAANPRFKEVIAKVEEVKPAQLGLCSLMEEMQPFGCSLNKYHGTVLRGYNVSEVKRALEKFYLAFAAFESEGDERAEKSFSECLPSIRQMVCDAFVPRCDNQCLPAKPCRSRCKTLQKSCIPKELMYTLNNVGVGQSQRHKLMSFMDELLKRKELFTWPLTRLPSAISAHTPTPRSA